MISGSRDHGVPMRGWGICLVGDISFVPKIYHDPRSRSEIMIRDHVYVPRSRGLDARVGDMFGGRYLDEK